MSTTATDKPIRKVRAWNPRVLVFACILLMPVAYVVYTFAKLSLGSGIEQVGDYKEVNLKAMGNFPFDDVTGTEAQVPEVYRGLDGQKVLLTGEMYSDFASSNYVDRFQLVYSIAKCCFGGPPKVQERVFAHAAAGKKVPLMGGLAKVYGTLHVRAIREDGRVKSLFDMDVERIEQY